MDIFFVFMKKLFTYNEQYTNDMLKCQDIVILIKEPQKSIACTICSAYVHFMRVVNLYRLVTRTLTSVHLIFSGLLSFLCHRTPNNDGCRIATRARLVWSGLNNGPYLIVSYEMVFQGYYRNYYRDFIIGKG